MKVDQERIHTLLVDTITMLCRNGLAFKTGIQVQGLLGITVDGSEVFLVQLDEKIISDSEGGISASKTANNSCKRSRPKTLQSHAISDGGSLRQLAIGYNAEQSANVSYSNNFDNLLSNRTSSANDTVSSAGGGDDTTPTCYDEAAIFIDSDGDDSGNVKQEAFLDEDQQVNYYSQSEYFADNQELNSRMLTKNVKPDIEQSYESGLEYNESAVQTQFSGTDDAFKAEPSDDVATNWNADTISDGSRMRKYGRPNQHFGNRGSSVWRRRQTRNKVLETKLHPRNTKSGSSTMGQQLPFGGYTQSDWPALQNVTKSFTCGLCAAVFKHQRSLWRHQVTVHGRPKIRVAQQLDAVFRAANGQE